MRTSTRDRLTRIFIVDLICRLIYTHTHTYIHTYIQHTHTTDSLDLQQYATLQRTAALLSGSTGPSSSAFLDLSYVWIIRSYSDIYHDICYMFIDAVSK